MNYTKFENTAAGWPLTKDRLAEMAWDNESIQLMMGAMAEEMDAVAPEGSRMRPLKDCVIVGGCHKVGEKGWALWNGELCEVMSSNDPAAGCLRLKERRVTVTAGAEGAVYEVEEGTPEALEADEGDLTQQTVRVERTIEWYEDTAGDRWAIWWRGCRRLMARAVPADMGDEWEEQPSGWTWSRNEEGQHLFRAQISGGRVHLSGDVTATLAAGAQTLTPIVTTGITIYTGMTKLCELNNRYAPAGDRLVPVLVNGRVVPGVIHGGELLMDRSLAVGDRVAVDTYYDL